MSLAESLTTFLEGNANITALLASADAIWANATPQDHDGYPAITYEISGDIQQGLLEGSVNELAIASVRLNIWDHNFKTCNDIATTVKSELNSYRGVFGANTAEHIIKENEFSTPQEDDTGLNRIVLEFQIAYH